MGFQIKYFVGIRVGAGRERSAKQLVCRLHGVVPIRLRNVQAQAREQSIRVRRRAGESGSRSINPDNSVLRSTGFAVAVDDVQVRGIYALAVGIFFEILLIARRRFRAAPHPQQRRGRKV